MANRKSGEAMIEYKTENNKPILSMDIGGGTIRHYILTWEEHEALKEAINKVVRDDS